MTGRADLAAAIGSLAALPGVSDAVEQARAACTELRWNPALRRRIPEAAAESRVRGARASAALEGAPYPIDLVREHAMGARVWADPVDPLERVVRGALQATAESEHIDSVVLRAPMQAWARLHTAATGGWLPDDQVGRPRVGAEQCEEFADLGPAPRAAAALERMQAVSELLAASAPLPIVVVAAVVHAEIVSARPFVRGNAVVARACERALFRVGGLDPTGVAVFEAGHAKGGAAAYLGSLAAYQRGDARGVGLWLEHCAGAVVAAAAAGVEICSAVTQGALGSAE